MALGAAAWATIMMLLVSLCHSNRSVHGYFEAPTRDFGDSLASPWSQPKISKLSSQAEHRQMTCSVSVSKGCTCGFDVIWVARLRSEANAAPRQWMKLQHRWGRCPRQLRQTSLALEMPSGSWGLASLGGCWHQMFPGPDLTRAANRVMTDLPCMELQGFPFVSC